MVFVYHDVTNQSSQFGQEYGLAVTTEAFYRQILWIKSNFHIIHPKQLLSEDRIPDYGAVVTFDDGFMGAFNNGLPVLKELGVPSVIFLNMRAILEKRPILSATACYLMHYRSEISEFMKSVGISTPLHLTLKPGMLELFEKRHGRIDFDAVCEYQGQFADLCTIKTWSDKDVVVYGNHLFDHWNAPALSIEEFEEQYKMDEIALSQLVNSINMFSFTNGQPATCFSCREVDLLKKLGARKVFSSAGGINRTPSKYLLDRIDLSESGKDEDHLWFRIGRAVFNEYLRNKA